jgi:bacterioferritin-associated ferredoxin
MYVCICNGITDRDIRDAARAGARDLDQLSATTGCTTSCGSCGELATEILRETLRESRPLPMLATAA